MDDEITKIGTALANGRGDETEVAVSLAPIDGTLPNAAAPVESADAAGMPALNPLEAAIDAGLATLDDPSLTRIGFLRAALQRAREIPVHPSRQAEAAAVLGEFVRLGVDTLRADILNAFARVPDLGRKFSALEQPLPLDLDRWRARVHEQVRAAGWSSAEADLLIGRLTPGEEIMGIDVSEIRLTGRTLTRRAIRDGGRPAWWKTAQGWNQANYERTFADGLPIPGERQV
ncbi:MAG TPA: hypothetical protein VNE82_10675 [Candidatus Binataceae bacterium]|nr:hypothetical protein [Candidatus Binataceae bacterium]